MWGVGGGEEVEEPESADEKWAGKISGWMFFFCSQLSEGPSVCLPSQSGGPPCAGPLRNRSRRRPRRLIVYGYFFDCHEGFLFGPTGCNCGTNYQRQTGFALSFSFSFSFFLLFLPGGTCKSRIHCIVGSDFMFPCTE